MYGVPGTKNISKHPDGFSVTKKFNGKKFHLAFGTTLIIALMKRDWCKVNGWKKYPVNNKYIVKTPQNHYRIQKSYRINGKFKTYYFGTFKRLSDAKKEVELLKKYDWDIQDLCDCESSL